MWKMKPSKYRNEKTEVDGITFHSKKEAARYQELLLLKQAKQIGALVLQPRFNLIVSGIRICTYIAAFQYIELNRLGHMVQIVEDVKGMRTPVYRIKRKLFEALYPHLTFRETRDEEEKPTGFNRAQ